MEKKKLFFISAASSIHTVKWVNSLSKNYEVHLIYCNNHQPKVDNINSNVILHRLPFNAPIGYYLNAFKLKKLYKNISPDIVNVHYASGYGTLARISRLDNIILSVWGSDVYDFPNQSKTKKRILEKNVKYAKYIASTSNAMAEKLKKQIPNLNKKLFITPFGVDTNKFYNYNLSKNNEYINIGTIKALEEKYGIKYAILAIKKIKEDLVKEGKKQIADSIKYYIYGEGSQREKLLRLIESEKLKNDVFIMGKIPNNEVPKILSKMDIFVALSIANESFGVALVEAMACEVPVVATDTDGFKEIVDDNITGFIVERKNIEKIAQKIKYLVENKDLRVKMGEAGRQKVLKEYDWQENVKMMEKIYLEIMNKKN